MRTSHDRLHQITSCEGRRGEEERGEGVFLNVGKEREEGGEDMGTQREFLCVFHFFFNKVGCWEILEF